MSKALYAVSALVLASCAATSEQSSMSQAQLTECLQPNRRVVVDINGRVAKPPAKKPEVIPPVPGSGKPEASAPEAKQAKPQFAAYQQALYIQGNSAFDPGSAVLKQGGMKEIEGLLADLTKRGVQVGAIIISGHTDRLEAEGGNKGLSEARAKAVKDYLAAKGLDEKLMFWEGKEARDPVPVTKFCS